MKQAYFWKYYNYNDFQFYCGAAREFCIDFLAAKLEGVHTIETITPKIDEIIKQDWEIQLFSENVITNIAIFCDAIIDRYRLQAKLFISCIPFKDLREMVWKFVHICRGHYEAQNGWINLKPVHIKTIRN